MVDAGGRPSLGRKHIKSVDNLYEQIILANFDDPSSQKSDFIILTGITRV